MTTIAFRNNTTAFDSRLTNNGLIITDNARK